MAEKGRFDKELWQMSRFKYPVSSVFGKLIPATEISAQSETIKLWIELN